MKLESKKMAQCEIQTGILMVNSEPTPYSVVKSIVPFSFSAASFAMNNPSPEPVELVVPL